jgi:hypothetical protein
MLTLDWLSFDMLDTTKSLRTELCVSEVDWCLTWLGMVLSLCDGICSVHVRGSLRLDRIDLFLLTFLICKYFLLEHNSDPVLGGYCDYAFKQAIPTFFSILTYPTFMIVFPSCLMPCNLCTWNWELNNPGFTQHWVGKTVYRSEHVCYFYLWQEFCTLLVMSYIHSLVAVTCCYPIEPQINGHLLAWHFIPHLLVASE